MAHGQRIRRVTRGRLYFSQRTFEGTSQVVDHTVSEPIAIPRDASNPSAWVGRLAAAAALLGFAMSRAYPATSDHWTPLLADYWATIAMTLVHVGFVLAAVDLLRKPDSGRRLGLPAIIAMGFAALTYAWVP